VSDLDREMSEEGYHLKSFMRSLKKRLAHRREWSLLEGTTGYRLFDRENNVPLTIDFFNEKYAVVVAFLDQVEAEWLPDEYLQVVSKALNVSADRIFYKERRKGAMRGVEKEVSDESVWIDMVEHGLSYKLNLSDYLDIGLFMDHRNLRRELMTQTQGVRVLNLFSYTSSLGMACAAGGASKVINVDLSQRYLDWGYQNFQRNGLLGDQFSFVRADVLTWLQEAQTQYKAYFDIIICDPPIFSNSRNMSGTLNIQRDYIWLIEGCMQLMRPKNGMLYFSSPLQTLHFESKKIYDARIQEITNLSVPYDFRKHQPHRCWHITWRFLPRREEKGRGNYHKSERSRY
jgi:23S rRNA (cytosine1962-C5)-methyltransferase